MTQTATSAWFRDPTGRHELRYWDGTSWTEHVSDAGATSTDPLAPAATVTPVAPAPASPAAASAPVVPAIRAEEYIDIVLNVPPDAARDAAVNALRSRGFRLAFGDEWSAVARKGEKAMTVAFGAFAQYYEIVVQVFLTASGETVVRLSRSPTGYWTGGGIVGRARVKGMFARIANEVVVWFQQQGLLVTTRHMT